MIRPAKLAEIPKIMAVAKDCAQHMIKHKIYQWNEHYPSEASFMNDLERNELFVKVMDKKIVGAIVITPHMDDEYGPIKWLTPSQNNMYVHRLCVHPNYQGKGHAQSLMDFAEKLAFQMRAPSVRLDTFSQNKRNQKFYEARGYQKLGDVFFTKQSEHPFHCYELVF